MTLETSPLRFQPVHDWEHLLDDPSIRHQILRGEFNYFHSQTRVRLESIRLTALRLFGPSPQGKESIIVHAVATFYHLLFIGY
jgi:hypothetical protein